MTKRVRKRCARCGHVGRYRPRERCCKAPRFGSGSYACWGDLMAVRLERVAPTKTPQDVAREKLARARRMVTAKTRAMRRLATSLRLWERRANYYAMRASMTTDELAAQRACRLAQAQIRANRTIRRAIQLPRNTSAQQKGDKL